MAHLTAITVGLPIRQDASELFEFRGKTHQFEADFRSKDFEGFVRVFCDEVFEFRWSDEFVHSSDSEELTGYTPSGFAYQMEGGRMLEQMHNSIQLALNTTLKQYLIISLNDCFVFVSGKPPTFKLVKAPDNSA